MMSKMVCHVIIEMVMRKIIEMKLERMVLIIMMTMFDYDVNNDDDV